MNNAKGKQPLNVLFINDTRPEKHLGCEMVVRNISDVILESGFAAIHYVTQRHLCMFGSCSEFLDGIALIVINGEGTLHGDRAIGYKIIQFVELGASKKIPVVLLNATLESNSKHFYDSFSALSEIVVRESASLQEISKIDIPKRVIADATFFTPFELISRIRSENISPKHIYIDDSVIPEVSLDLAVLRSKLKAKSVTLFFSNNKFFSSWLFLKRVPRSLLRSPFLMMKFLLLLPRQVCCSKRSFEEFCLYVSGAELVITGRFHMVCILLLLEIPFLAVESNTKKISSLLKDVGIAGRVFSTVADLERHFHECSNHNFTAEERMSIARFKQDAHIGRAKLIDILSSYSKRRG
ncbi:polysaccharide pyruvyl transferase CsaB [Stutzerimonas stutzeri]|uniref:polysaccharide pyruvyl transferase family protein n=1 Tax=Stutzerimonas stutzeri subgroup TaxID=578833 RepID=UPI000C6D7C5E|nr:MULTISPECIES: polysaccharide pyruvyl transferase family protein [Stutzerimonas stutzeri subgroup]MCQ2047196.1 polysaccharide pyruvyl transferase family protein [Stutzerimonas kunmingensis]PKR28486.1 hypothetical protein CXK90_07880 [Stutzerimonas stutzeri]QQC10084.1 polysaccharide pyruvyl transferase family protein [Stutzerimonas stutzeri]VEI33867.1 polysaccharide pyruvyl transferase CsaB [Stutzerimonas stutzeri]